MSCPFPSFSDVIRIAKLHFSFYLPVPIGLKHLQILHRFAVFLLQLDDLNNVSLGMRQFPCFVELYRNRTDVKLITHPLFCFISILSNFQQNRRRF